MDTYILTDQQPTCPRCNCLVEIIEGADTKALVCHCAACEYTFRLEAEESSDPSRYSHAYAEHPGVTLKKVLEDRDMTQTALAQATNMAIKTINEIVMGKAHITAETALKFEMVLGVPADEWMRLDAAYRIKQVRLKYHE